MRRGLLTALMAIPLIVAAFYGAEKLISRQMLIAQCENDKGSIEDRGVFGDSRCVLGINR